MTISTKGILYFGKMNIDVYCTILCLSYPGVNKRYNFIDPRYLFAECLPVLFKYRPSLREKTFTEVYFDRKQI